MSAAAAAMKSILQSATSEAADCSTTIIGYSCNFAKADWPAGRAIGAITGWGNDARPTIPPRTQLETFHSQANGLPVGKDIKLTASDNFQLGGYRADPATPPKAAVVVVQEIFGVNHHIRAVCDRLAKEGYVAVAPSIFDRI